MSSVAARRDAAVRRRDWAAIVALLGEAPLSEKRVRERLVTALERLRLRESVPALERIALDDREGKYGSTCCRQKMPARTPPRPKRSVF